MTSDRRGLGPNTSDDATSTGGGREAPEWTVWSWTGGRRDGQTGVSWLGVLLVLLGVAFLINQVNRQISFTSMFLLALGLAFGAAWLVGGWRSATVPALVLLALGISRLASDLNVVTGSGWTPLALGIAFLIAWAVSPFQKTRRNWALWFGLILGIYGFAQVSSVLVPGLPDLPWLWPAVLIGIGVLLLFRRRMDDRRAV
jgi:hypothetical protein